MPLDVQGDFLAVDFVTAISIIISKVSEMYKNANGTTVQVRVGVVQVRFGPAPDSVNFRMGLRQQRSENNHLSYLP